MIRQELEAMLFSHRYRAGAGEFAEKYSVFDFAAPENMAVARVAEVIESIAIPTYRRMTRVKGSEAIVGI